MNLPERTHDRKCHIVGAGPLYGYDIEIGPDDILIAADAGLRNLKEGQIPDILLGDFDSLGSRPEGYDLVILPEVKDLSDTLAAVDEGLKRGYREFLIYGGTGGRADHTIANLQTLAYLVEHGARGWLLGQQNISTVMGPGTLKLEKGNKGFISIFAYGGGAEGVSLKGFKYNIFDTDLSAAYPLGLSNELMGLDAEIVLMKGSLLIVYEREYERVRTAW